MPGGKRNKKFHHHQKKKPWKNQRKKEQQDDQKKEDRRGAESTSNDFILATITKGNYKFEAYYAAQGLHDHRYNKVDNDKNGEEPQDSLLHSNSTLEEWQTERLAWRTALGSILPASFRFNGMLSPSVQQTMHQELMQLVRQARDWKPSSTQPKEQQEQDDDTPKQDDDDDKEEKQDTLEDPQQQQQQQQDTTAANTNTTTAPTPLPPPEMDGTTNETNNNHDTTVADPSTTTTTTPQLVDWQPLTEDDTHLTRIPFVTDPWGLAYQWSVLDRNQLRKHPALQPIKEWLVQKTSSGQVTRQETVSMIPPIVLLSQLLVQQQQQQQELPTEPLPTVDTTSNDPTKTKKNTSHSNNKIGLTVLDLCAAPGSKTSQLLEGMSQLHGSRTRTSTTSHGWPEQAGVLVANDVNPNRANMLTHQLKRVLHQFPVAVVTAAPAQFLSFGSSNSQEPQQTFDAILADVPCSGDGTTRKNIQVWNTWSQMGALSLHPLQLDIAWQGLSSLLSNDGNGILCYSTCSMNPMENEAVVAELLRRGQGAVELVECRPVVHGSTTPKSGGFRTRPGWSTWKVLCEPLSRKQMKHRDNKHKAKMQEKRQQHHEQEQAQAKQDGPSYKSTTTTHNDQDDSLSATAAAPHQPPGDGHEHERNVALAAQPYSPTSMDPCYLMELATHVAGYRHFTSMDQVHEAGLHQRIRPSCFPPTEAWIQDQLKRCIRCLPHDNNTGGFFVALLHKKGPIPNANKKEVDKKDVDKKNNDDDDKKDKESNEAETKSVSPPKEPPIKRAKMERDAPENPEPIKDAVDTTTSTTATKEQNPQGGQKRRRNDHQQNQRQVFVPVKDELLDPLIEYYGFGGPGFRKDLFMARSNSECKVIYFLAPSVKDFLFPPSSGSNTSSSVCDSVNVIATGLKAFCKNNSIKECPISHRIAQEAAHFLAPYMSDRRKLTVCRSDFQACLRPPPEGKGAAIPLDENFSTEFVQHVRGLDVGAFVVVLEQGEETTDSMVLVLWRCRGDHINTLVSAVEVDAIQSKLAAQTQHGNSAGATTATKTAATNTNTSGLQEEQEQHQDMSTEMK